MTAQQRRDTGTFRGEKSFIILPNGEKLHGRKHKYCGFIFTSNQGDTYIFIITQRFAKASASRRGWCLFRDREKFISKHKKELENEKIRLIQG